MRSFFKQGIIVLAMTILLPATSFGAEQFYKIGTASSGGLFNALGISFAQIWTRVIPDVSFSAQITGGSGANALGVNANKYDIGFITGDVAYDAYSGLNQFKGKEQKKLAGIANLYPAVMQVVVLKASNIKGVDDLKGKRINIGQAGSGSAIAAEIFLSWFGLQPDKNFTPSRLSHSAGADALMDEKIDGYINSGTVGQSWHMRALTSGKATMVPFADERTQKFCEANPSYYAFTIPVGSYPDLEDALQTIATSTLLVVSADMPEAHVYAMTKAIFDNLKELAQMNNVIASLTPKNAVEGVSIPMHPGAAKYFREQGVIK